MGHSYRDLIVWQKSIVLVTEVYRATRTFPKEEIYGLTSQARRSAVSVASNIAEGQGRITKPEFRQFLGMARGSLLELETQLLIASNLGYLTPQSAGQLSQCSGTVSRLLHGLMQSLEQRKSVVEITKTTSRKSELRIPETRNRKLETAHPVLNFLHV